MFYWCITFEAPTHTGLVQDIFDASHENSCLGICCQLASFYNIVVSEAPGQTGWINRLLLGYIVCMSPNTFSSEMSHLI